MEQENLQPIYTIMVFTRCEKDKNGWCDMGSTRVVGFRHTFEDADESVRLNMCDIWERCYCYAVIEEVEPTIYPCSTKRWFYKFNEVEEKYEPIDVPNVFDGFCGLSMG